MPCISRVNGLFDRAEVGIKFVRRGEGMPQALPDSPRSMRYTRSFCGKDASPSNPGNTCYTRKAGQACELDPDLWASLDDSPNFSM